MNDKDALKHLKVIEGELEYLTGYVNGVILQVESLAKLKCIEAD